MTSTKTQAEMVIDNVTLREALLQSVNTTSYDNPRKIDTQHALRTAVLTLEEHKSYLLCKELGFIQRDQKAALASTADYEGKVVVDKELFNGIHVILESMFKHLEVGCYITGYTELLARLDTLRGGEG